MHKLVMASTVIAVGLGLWGCGGESYGGGNDPNAGGTPTSPTPSGDSGVVTINVVAVNGAQSFSPNPSTVRAGQKVVWHNVDNITHRVVLNDRSVDTGDLSPGASSQAMTIAGSGAQYHCTIHPIMTGSINHDTQTTAPCQGAYCN